MNIGKTLGAAAAAFSLVLLASCGGNEGVEGEDNDERTKTRGDA